MTTRITGIRFLRTFLRQNHPELSPYPGRFEDFALIPTRFHGEAPWLQQLWVSRAVIGFGVVRRLRMDAVFTDTMAKLGPN